MGILESKQVVITGGSLGIGLAVAKRCVEEGARVAIAARGAEALEAARAALTAIADRQHLARQVDVGDLESVEAFAAWARDALGGIDGLVNCAGVYGPIGKSTEVDLRAFKRAIEINLLGTVAMCQAMRPLFRDGAQKKKIVNFSGGGAATPFPQYSAYATSKVALVRFTENLALELADEGFEVNCVAPGFVLTRLHQETLAAGPSLAGARFFENTQKQLEGGGVPPERAAELTAYLLSSASDGISGRFLSAPWDPWQDAEFREALRADPDLATLRRIDRKQFHKR